MPDRINRFVNSRIQQSGHSRSAIKGASRPICQRKLLPATKHFAAFYVCIGEGEDKLNVAEKFNDAHSYQTTAPDGRSAKPFAGTIGGIAPASDGVRAIAARSAPPRFF